VNELDKGFETALTHLKDITNSFSDMSKRAAELERLLNDFDAKLDAYDIQ
jgi:hypothetical protein